jgi:hypothetical protein
MGQQQSGGRHQQQQQQQSDDEIPPHLRPIPITFDNLPRAPYDDNGMYIQSFTVNEIESYKQFFDEYGFVVIRDVLSNDEIDQSIQDIWNVSTGNDSTTRDMFHMMSKQDDFIPVDRNDPTTWTSNNGWPSMEQVGILGGRVAIQPSAFVNRQSENIYSVFSELLERKDLLVSFDRFGVMRPTKQVLLNNGVDRRDFPRYQTRDAWMHWVCNVTHTIMSLIYLFRI